MRGQIRTTIRPAAAAALWPLVRPWRGRLERARDGSRLPPGITAVVVARNEGYAIRVSLRSMVGFADQIICVDNGSDDSTLAQMYAFREEFGDRAAIDVVSLPSALLVECRQAGMRLTRHQWHFRWDADMVAARSILRVRERVLANDRPRAVKLSYANLMGDLGHRSRLGPVIQAGEYYLTRFGRHIAYRERGRYEELFQPKYYALVTEPENHIFHLGSLKPDVDLLYRFHYFPWREVVNRDGAALDPELRTFEGFVRRRNQELFGTTDPCSVKYRYRRQLAYHFAPYDPEEFGPYPEVLEEALTRPQRFEVVYRAGRPWTRIDHEDAEMGAYEPTAEDLAWDPEAFLRRFTSADQWPALGIAPDQSA